MTITLKPWMTAILIATFCALAGFAVGQVTTAQSAKDARASAYVPRVQDKAVLKQLKKLNSTIELKLGDKYRPGTALGQLHQILENTGYTCRAVVPSGWPCDTID